MLLREQIREALRTAFEPQVWALAMWEAGSASFGRVDEYSDLDLQFVVSADKVEEAFAHLEAQLEVLGGVTLRYRVPEPAWHGQNQCFYQLRQASPYLMLDVVFVREGSEFKLTERELHGEPQIVFDKGQHIRVTALEPTAHMQLLAGRIESLSTSFPLFLPLVEKEIVRGRALDALGFYQSFAIRPLVELLRIIHDPARYNFGLRYLSFDLPAEATERLTRLAFATDLNDMRGKLEEVRIWFAELLESAAASQQV